MTDKYCPDIHHGMYIEKTSAELANVGFCCLNAPVKNVNELDFTTTLQEERTNFPSDTCNSCWRAERMNAPSRRHGIIQWYNNKQINNKDLSLVSLDYNTENVCNLACITCGPRFSSRWVQESLSLSLPSYGNLKQYSKHNKLIDSLDFSNIKRVYFNGGEPLLTDDHCTVLNKIKQDKGSLNDVDVSYNTNATMLPSADVISLWAECRVVKLSLSLDATGSAFEFIRYPANWETVERNINLLKEQNPNLMFDITFTLGLHNIFYLEDTLTWYEDNLLTNKLGDPVSFNLQPCGAFSHGGRVLVLSNLGYEAKQAALAGLIRAKKYTFYNSILSELNKQTITNIGAIEYLDMLSNKRKVNWQDSLSKLAAVI